MQLAPERVYMQVLLTMGTSPWIHFAYYFLGAYFHWGSRRHRRVNRRKLRGEAEGTTDGGDRGVRGGRLEMERWRQLLKAFFLSHFWDTAVNHCEGWVKLIWQLPLGMNWLVQILWALRGVSNLVPEPTIFSHIVLLGHFWHGSRPFMG